jgi:UDPglucose--hexose-1-phosphate uridylyltransferase
VSLALDLSHHPHRRLNALTGEWVLVSPHRTARPWQGQTEDAAGPPPPSYDPLCYMCPGNRRANGAQNPDFATTFVFDNDFPALRSDTPREELAIGGVTAVAGEPGICRVVCFSPRHDLTLATLDDDALRAVVETWVAEVATLEQSPGVGYVQVFENRGAMMGASNPHPHGQIWASARWPNVIETEHARQRAYQLTHSRQLLADYLAFEIEAGERLVCGNDEWVAVVPFWAVWPFETLVIPRGGVSRLPALDAAARRALGPILRELTSRYDRLFATPFPYSMGFHGAPVAVESADGFRLHVHFYPPLLRSATIRKFMVGYELLAMPQRDLTPEEAAARLRDA